MNKEGNFWKTQRNRTNYVSWYITKYVTGINKEGGKILEMINEEGGTFARRGQSLEKQSETPRLSERCE